MESFSARELEVFTLMGRGLERSEIAGELNLSPKTVDTHRQSLKEKLSVDTAAQLWRRAVLWVELESV